MVYSVATVRMYYIKGIWEEQRSYVMCFKIWSSLGLGYTYSKFTIRKTIFLFSSKISFFGRLGALFLNEMFS